MVVLTEFSLTFSGQFFHEWRRDVQIEQYIPSFSYSSVITLSSPESNSTMDSLISGFRPSMWTLILVVVFVSSWFYKVPSS